MISRRGFLGSLAVLIPGVSLAKCVSKESPCCLKSPKRDGRWRTSWSFEEEDQGKSVTMTLFQRIQIRGTLVTDLPHLPELIPRFQRRSVCVHYYPHNLIRCEVVDQRRERMVR